MHAFTLLVTGLAVLTSVVTAAPTEINPFPDQSNLKLRFRFLKLRNLSDIKVGEITASVTLNHLTSIEDLGIPYGTVITQISLLPTTGLMENLMIECQAFSDHGGLNPNLAPFDYSEPWTIPDAAWNPEWNFNSIRCYIPAKTEMPALIDRSSEYVTLTVDAQSHAHPERGTVQASIPVKFNELVRLVPAGLNTEILKDVEVTEIAVVESDDSSGTMSTVWCNAYSDDEGLKIFGERFDPLKPWTQPNNGTEDFAMVRSIRCNQRSVIVAPAAPALFERSFDDQFVQLLFQVFTPGEGSFFRTVQPKLNHLLTIDYQSNLSTTDSISFWMPKGSPFATNDHTVCSAYADREGSTPVGGLFSTKKSWSDNGETIQIQAVSCSEYEIAARADNELPSDDPLVELVADRIIALFLNATTPGDQLRQETFRAKVYDLPDIHDISNGGHVPVIHAITVPRATHDTNDQSPCCCTCHGLNGSELVGTDIDHEKPWKRDSETAKAEAILCHADRVAPTALVKRAPNDHYVILNMRLDEGPSDHSWWSSSGLIDVGGALKTFEAMYRTREIEFFSSSDDVDINKVQCRAFNDTKGEIQIGNTFSEEEELELPHRGLRIRAISCNVTDSPAKVERSPEDRFITLGMKQDAHLKKSKKVKTGHVSVDGFPHSLDELLDAAYVTWNTRTIEFSKPIAGVDSDKVECRAYSDLNGRDPIGEPFTEEDEFDLPGSRGQQLRAVRCWIVEDAQVEERAADDHFVSLLMQQNAPGIMPWWSPSGPVEIGALTPLDATYSTTVIGLTNPIVGVDFDQVECRAYQDTMGSVQAGETFDYMKAWQLDGQAVDIRAVRCDLIPAPAAPAQVERSDETSYVMATRLGLKPSIDSKPWAFQPVPVQLGVLTPFDYAYITTGIKLTKPTSDANIDNVECYAFGDKEGSDQYGAPFTHNHGWELGGAGAVIQSILCIA